MRARSSWSRRRTSSSSGRRPRQLGFGDARLLARPGLGLASSEAERAARVGIAEALAIEEQVRAYGGPRYQLTQQVMARFAEAVERAGIDIVPKIVISGDGHGSGDGADGTSPAGGHSVLEALLTILLSERMGIDVAGTTAPSPAAAAVREELQRRLAAGEGGQAA